MTKPCTDCKYCEFKAGIAGDYFCNKKRVITSIARITDSKGRHTNEECFEHKGGDDEQ